MERQALVDYCKSKPDSHMGFPFGAIPIVFKYKNRIFAEIYPEPDNYKLTVRCDPGVGEVLREKYPGTVIPGYHVPLRQQKFKNTILLDKGIDEKAVLEMIDHSYTTIA